MAAAAKKNPIASSPAHNGSESSLGCLHDQHRTIPSWTEKEEQPARLYVFAVEALMRDMPEGSRGRVTM
ncbi:hypothetical protein HKM21_16185 [Longimicrobium terrae]|uniref:Uncharacterized protein n=1 Tax=Longimicrobium terrae TaxID=1639882 RepID=A0A841GX60_9BACT|nr:hypothetical protein [Longimicrobium terrae]MBB6070305.1 hypothetical protein [Longimicrobium terrae]NNC30807.1 hypothetical protein [Longimicrobium terrae]